MLETRPSCKKAKTLANGTTDIANIASANNGIVGSTGGEKRLRLLQAQQYRQIIANHILNVEEKLCRSAGLALCKARDVPESQD